MSSTKLIVLAGAALITGAALGFVASLLRPRHYGASGLLDVDTADLADEDESGSVDEKVPMLTTM